jgi:hypothetical protein
MAIDPRRERRGAMPSEVNSTVSIENASLQDHLNALASQLKFSHRELPLRRQILSRCMDHIYTLKSLVPNSPTIADPARLKSIVETLNSIKLDVDKDIETAWNAKNLLRLLSVEVADDLYLYQLLSIEKTNSKNGGFTNPWQDSFDKADMERLLGNEFLYDHAQFRSISAREDARLKLRTLYKEQFNLERHQRAVEETRGMYLRKLTYKLLPFLGLVCMVLIGGFSLDVAIFWSNCVGPLLDSPEPEAFSWAQCKIGYGGTVGLDSLVLVLAGGALGSLLALMLKFRNTLARMTEFRSNWGIVYAQATIGATSALIVFFAVKAGVVSIAGVDVNGSSLIPIGLVAFAAGFSEPMLVGIVGRLAGAAGK